MRFRRQPQNLKHREIYRDRVKQKNNCWSEGGSVVVLGYRPGQWDVSSFLRTSYLGPCLNNGPIGPIRVLYY